MAKPGGGGRTGGGSRSGSAGAEASPIPHTRVEDEVMLEELYAFGERLGQGSFGVVREATHRETGGRWACKAIHKEKAGSSAIKLLEREVSILKKVSHPHIIGLKEVLETPKRMYLMMELCEGGELADVLAQQGCFSETDTRTIMGRLASAISYLHKKDMVHRDLKLENILLSTNPEDSLDKLFIKVTDFGLSVVKGGVGHDNMLMDFCGTPMYMSPEIIDNKTYSEKCDVWAMGVIMYNLLCGSPPFMSKDEEHLYEIIKSAMLDFDSDPVWHSISKEAKDCIQVMLRVDPAYRVSASEVLMHPWMVGRKLEETAQHKTVLDMMREFAVDTKREEESHDGSVNGDSQPGCSQGEESSSDGGSRSGSASGSKDRHSTSSQHSDSTKGNSSAPRRIKPGCSPPLKPAASSTGKMVRNNSFPNSPVSMTTRTGPRRSPVGGAAVTKATITGGKGPSNDLTRPRHITPSTFRGSTQVTTKMKKK